MRRIAAFLLVLALLLPFAPSPVRAADSYLITIAGEKVLDNTDDNGMAVYMDSIIYIPYTTLQFTGGVSVLYNEDTRVVTVWRLRAMMHFELDTGATYDLLNGRTWNIPAKMRDGVPYLPLAILATWMDLYFSFISADRTGTGYPAIRLASGTPSVSDAVLLRRISTDLKQVAEARDRKSGIIGEPPPVEIIPERDIALMFTGVTPAEGAQSLLPVLVEELDAYAMTAGIFFSEEELLPQAAALRELYCKGIPIGIRLTDNQQPLNQARRCGDLLAQLLHARIRLVCANGLELTAEQEQALTAAGYVLWKADHEPDTGSLTAGKLMTRLRTTLKNAPDRSVLHLNISDISLEVLPMLYSYLGDQNFTIVKMLEWTPPFRNEKTA